MGSGTDLCKYGYEVRRGRMSVEEYRDPAVIASRDRPVLERGALAVVRGSLAPDGAVIKRSAA